MTGIADGTSDNSLTSPDSEPLDVLRDPALRRPLLIAARRVLLDALDALAPHHDGLVLVGAQALYLRTEDAGTDLVIAGYTHDGDLAIEPSRLADEPHLEQALRDASFDLKHPDRGGVEPGVWVRTTQVEGIDFEIPVDLLIPSSLVPGSRRGIAPPPHDRDAARRIPGLEAVLVDNSPMVLTALEPTDDRQHEIAVAGPAALLVCKMHKINDRLGDFERRGKDRLNEGKDAADVFRLMRSHDPDEIGAQLAELTADSRAGNTTSAALDLLSRRFASPQAAGVNLAVQALTLVVAEAEVRDLCVAWSTAVLTAVGSHRAGG